MNKLEKALAEAGYEIVGGTHLQGLIIQPLRKVEKQSFKVQMFEETVRRDEWLLDKELVLTPTQADKVAAFLEAGMEYITKEISWGPTGTYVKFDKAADVAREALEGTNE